MKKTPIAVLAILAALAFGAPARAAPLSTSVLNVKDYGAKGIGTDDGAAIQAAVDAASAAGGATVTVPPGVYGVSLVVPKSNVTIACEQGATFRTILTATHTFFKASGAGSLSNFYVRGCTFDGSRVAKPPSAYSHIFAFYVGAGESVANVSFVDNTFRDAQEDFIRFVSLSATGKVSRVRIAGNRFETTAAKRALGGTSYSTASDAVRIEHLAADGVRPALYGEVVFTDIDISGNFAESIRTLADVKRGARGYVISTNRTRNMRDCHHSADGSFDGTVTGNIGTMDADYSGPMTNRTYGANFFEVQGEQVSVTGNVFNANGKAQSGIIVTAYGRPEETVGAGHHLGHPSVGVTVSGNAISGIVVNALRVIDSVSCSLVDNSIENVGAHVATVEQSGANYDGTDAVLVPRGNRVAGNRHRSVAYGVKIQGTANVLGMNPDKDGADDVYMPTSGTHLLLASTYGNYLKDAEHLELNPNPLLELTGTGVGNNVKYTLSAAYPEATTSASPPVGVTRATVANDDSTTLNRAIYFQFPAVKGQRVYGRVWIKRGTATSASVLVQEYDAANAFISSTFYGLGSTPANWTEYVFAHKVASAATASLRVALVPAASNNDNTPTGTTEFANLRLGRAAIGR